MTNVLGMFQKRYYHENIYGFIDEAYVCFSYEKTTSKPTPGRRASLNVILTTLGGEISHTSCHVEPYSKPAYF